MTLPRRLLCSLAGVVLLAVPASASALDTGRIYDASIVTTAPQPVGFIMFAFDGSDTGDACGYTYRWIDPGLGMPARGSVVEAKAQGSESCTVDSRTSFPTFVELAPGASAEAFDYFGQRLPVLALLLGETTEGELSGMITLTTAVPTVYSLDILPRRRPP